MAGALYWLASYPKSGNTWLRIFLSNLLGDGTPSDINELRLSGMASARAWIDEVLGIATADLSAAELARLRPLAHAWMADELEQPRYEKTHDACLRLPDGRPWMAGVARAAVYLVRNPLDVAVSAADHWGLDIATAITRMNDPDMRLSAGRSGLAPQVPQSLSNWSAHVASWADDAPCPVLVLRYEDLHATPQLAFGRAAAFLDIPASPAQVERAWRQSEFAHLAAQEQAHGFAERGAGPRFFRQGRVGQWREVLDAPSVERIVRCHAAVMARFGYLAADGSPV